MGSSDPRFSGPGEDTGNVLTERARISARASGEVKIPECDTSDPAQLEAWYGNFGYADHYRKVVIANCQEIERAKASGEKITESRLDALARLNPIYLTFLATHLDGRRIREMMIREAMGA